MDDDSQGNLIGFFRSLFGKKRHSLEAGEALTEEIHEIMDEGQAKGLITGEESDMVFGVLDLKEIQAHSIMIPRTEISSASIDSTLSEIIALVAECGHTRIPIYTGTIDEIVGILHAKDLLKYWGKDQEQKISRELVRKPYFTPGNRKIGEILKDLKAKKTHLAIVTDEYGGTAGIITVEDIVEEIVGEILDEHDEDLSLLTVIDDDTCLVDARLEAEKLQEHLQIELPQGEFESVGGFVIHLLGKIPKVNESVLYKNVEMTIVDADERRINKVRLTRHPTEPPPPEENGPP